MRGHMHTHILWVVLQDEVRGFVEPTLEVNISQWAAGLIRKRNLEFIWLPVGADFMEEVC